MTLDELARKSCTPLKGKENAVLGDTLHALLSALPGWTLSHDGNGIEKEFRFDDFHRTMAFVNAVAWIAHAEDHHPDFKVSYPSCALYYSTHDVGGLSLNDFISAAKVERLLKRD
jgi:4a-hydroxytetrahydrobiopterin dehydratase